MFGDTFGAVIKLALASFVIMLMITFFSYDRVQDNVSDLVYDTAESVSTLGVLSENSYDGLIDTIDRYSIGDAGLRYVVQLKLEKQIEPNTFDVFFESSEDRKNNTSRKGTVVGRPLDVGDRITIYVEDRTPSLIDTLLKVVTFEGNSEVKVRASQTAIVAKRMTDMVKGYDVIADLNTNPFTYDKKIVVVTKTNDVGYIYTTPSNLPSYRTYALADASNINYIFPNGEFHRSEDIIGGVRTITYAQRY